jgi:hypothetical protein
LRFRTAADLLPAMSEADGEKPRYKLRDRSDKRWRFFEADQVEPAPGAHSGQMRVRCDLPSPYRCKYVQPADQGPDLPKVRWALQRLGDVLKGIHLDVTHRDSPPCHTILVWAKLKTDRMDGKTLDQISQAMLTGQGLAAWDIFSPKFKVRLKAVEPDRAPILRNLVDSIPPELRRNLEKIREPLQGYNP